MNAAQAFGARLRELRNAQGLSIRDLSARAGFTDVYAGMVERAERNTSVESADRLARALGADLGRLMDPAIPIGSTLLTPCGNCHGLPPAGFRCLSCGLEGERDVA